MTTPSPEIPDQHPAHATEPSEATDVEPAGPAGEPAAAAPAGPALAPAVPAALARKRPLIERLGMAVIALVLGALFAVVAVAAFIGGEPFLGVMGAIGCLMVLWVGGLTLFRG